jgi:hypothetical protein
MRKRNEKIVGNCTAANWQANRLSGTSFAIANGSDTYKVPLDLQLLQEI